MSPKSSYSIEYFNISDNIFIDLQHMIVSKTLPFKESPIFL